MQQHEQLTVYKIYRTNYYRITNSYSLFFKMQSMIGSYKQKDARKKIHIRIFITGSFSFNIIEMSFILYLWYVIQGKKNNDVRDGLPSAVAFHVAYNLQLHIKLIIVNS